MALNDVRIAYTPYSSTPTYTFLVDDRGTSSDTVIYPGDPIKILAGESGNYAGHLATGDPEYGTDIVIGIAASTSTETASVNGTVEAYMPLPGMIYKCKATTPANLAVGVVLDTVTFDLTSTTYTVDEDEGSDENVHGLRIMGYDSAGYVYFIMKGGVTILDSVVA